MVSVPVFAQEGRAYALRLHLFLVCKTVWVLWLIVGGAWGLSPDEAQYWTWSQELAVGYYSKPPGIAWQMALTTGLLGNTELGVRLGALALGYLLTGSLYLWARTLECTPQTAFWAALFFGCAPVGMYLSFAATTDGGALLFLVLASLCCTRVLRTPTRGLLYLMGLCVLLGGLYKWTAFVFWPLALPFLLRPCRHMWRSLGGAVLLSLCAFLPSLYWNFGHDWATFKHVGKTLAGVHGGNALDFLGAQVGLLSPVVLGFVLLGIKRLPRTLPWAFCGVWPLLLVGYFAVALFKKMQPNWALFVYPAACVCAAYCAVEYVSRRWRVLAVACGALLILGGLALTPLQQHGWLARYPLAYKLNPYQQTLGWRSLAAACQASGYRPERDFLFADKYQVASLLSFYAPGQERAYVFNISDSRNNQFTYWPQMTTQEVGKTGYFVVLERGAPEKADWYIQHYTQRLAPYFTEVTCAGVFPLFSAYGQPVKFALFLRCTGYTGTCPTVTPHF